MINTNEIFETIKMIKDEHLDIRTITMGISLLDCVDASATKSCDKIYDKITRYAENLVKTGDDIGDELGIPIINKRISVTPIAMVAGASDAKDYVCFAKALDRAARTTGVNSSVDFQLLFIRGFLKAMRFLLALFPRHLR